MHLRRALLLFAIVLGLAAVAASVSRPRDESRLPATTAETPPPSTVETDGEAARGSDDVTFDALLPRSHEIEAGQAATVVVKVPGAGQVSIDGLGMTAAAEQVTPARFDVLTATPGRYPITFTPAGSNAETKAGTLVVKPSPG